MASIDTVSKAEAIKQQSRQLRGNLARDLADTATPFDNAGYSLLKFHGIYQGYDRDSATERKQRGDDKVWQFMVRVRIPGGRLTADQYLALDDLADRYANGSLRVTTRQSIQFHGVVKPGLKAAIGQIDESLLTTLAACGDVVRTVTTVPAPLRAPIHRRLEDDARRLSTHLLPKTGAYHEIWVDGAKVTPDEEEPVDPLYGERYLPRKFKCGLAIPEDNTIDVLTNDLAIVALFEGERLLGYNFLLGGGHGMTHNKPATYPRLALREIVARFGCNPILMPSQDIILSDIDPADRDRIAAILKEHRVRLAEELLPVERWALACPALPSCGLALTEAERVQGDIVGAIAERLKRWGLERERLSIRITGCPNGCARPYTGDIGIVGRVPGSYSLYVGGDFAGTRLNEAIAERLDIAGLAD